MDNPLLGRSTERGNHLPHDVDRRLRIGRAVACQPLLEILTCHVLLGDEMDAVDATDLMDLHDIGMDQRGGRTGFVVEPTHVGFVLGQTPLEDLESHLPTERELFGQIDIRHAATPQASQQLIVAQFLSRQIGIGTGILIRRRKN